MMMPYSKSPIFVQKFKLDIFEFLHQSWKIFNLKKYPKIAKIELSYQKSK